MGWQFKYAKLNHQTPVAEESLKRKVLLHGLQGAFKNLLCGGKKTSRLGPCFLAPGVRNLEPPLKPDFGFNLGPKFGFTSCLLLYVWPQFWLQFLTPNFGFKSRSNFWDFSDFPRGPNGSILEVNLFVRWVQCLTSTGYGPSDALWLNVDETPDPPSCWGPTWELEEDEFSNTSFAYERESIPGPKEK